MAKKKNILKLMIFLPFLLTLSLLFLSSCNKRSPQNVHSHYTADNVLQYDEVSYFRICDMCGERYDITPHKYGSNSDDPVCGYKAYMNSYRYTLNDDKKSYILSSVINTPQNPFTAISIEIPPYHYDAVSKQSLPVTTVGDSRIYETVFHNCNVMFADIGNNVTTFDPFAFSTTHYYYGSSCGFDFSSAIFIKLGKKINNFLSSFPKDKLLEICNQSSLTLDKYLQQPIHVITDEKDSYLHTTNDGFVFYDDPNGQCYLMGYISNNPDMILPKNYNNKNYSLYPYAFCDNHVIKSVDFNNLNISIPTCAFAYTDNLESIANADNIISFDSNAFYSSALQSLTLFSDTLTSIGERSFSCCEKLKSVKLNCKNLTIIANYAFDAPYDWSNDNLRSVLETVDLSGCDKLLSSGTYRYNANLYSVILPDNMQTIDERAFDDCESLTEIHLPAQLRHIGECAFGWCSSIISLTLPEHIPIVDLKNSELIEAMEDGSYYKLHEVICPFDNLYNQLVHNLEHGCPCHVCKSPQESYIHVYDEYYYFYFNPVLDECYLMGLTFKGKHQTTLNPPTSFIYIDPVTNITYNKDYIIYMNAFVHSTTLVSINIPFSFSHIFPPTYDAPLEEGLFKTCTSLKYVTIPDAINLIDNKVFQNCISLESITIPQKVRWICGSAFRNCIALTHIVIPKNVKKISGGAFLDCSNLKTTKFDDPYGWTVKSYDKEITINPQDLINEETAALYLTQTYINYDWIKTPTPAAQTVEQNMNVKITDLNATVKSISSINCICYCDVYNLESKKNRF